MYEPGSGDDYIDDGYQTEQSELGLDTHIPFPTGDDLPPSSGPTTQRARRVRVRPMSAAMMQRLPDVYSVLMTKTDGRQVLLVRRS